ncbi:MAG: hypothetical protein K8U03_11505 [Planctomycetia bacterium]|nr:hypothetical protein [Planctomycetia bacterium]
MDDVRRMDARRIAGISVGVGVHAFFVVTVYYLYGFLEGCPPRPGGANLIWDALLGLQFAVVHSLLLWHGVRDRLERFIPGAFYGLFFCFATCATLLLAISQWEVGTWAVWQLEGAARTAMQATFIATWGLLLYSLSLNGFGYQTGFTPWWHWVRRRPLPRREFKPRGAYLLLRHPVYLSFMGLLWFTPDMTIDRAVLTGLWTIYIFVGSHLKDLRLIYYVGERYRQYQTRVPGYPGFFFGPLGRRKIPVAAPLVLEFTTASPEAERPKRIESPATSSVG